MSLKHRLRRVLWKAGYDFFRFDLSHPLVRRKRLLEHYGIDVVLDVGANTGQFAGQLRYDIGYSGRIISFEPLSSAFDVLQRTARGDRKWIVRNYALGDAESECRLNIAGNSFSSSLLGMLPSHMRAAPESRYVGSEVVTVKTLDSVFDDICTRDDNIYLKIDTQGFEEKVLKGAESALAHIDTVQVEMSLVPLYQDELLFNEMCELLATKGYSLVAIEAGGLSIEHSGQLLQVDGIFHRC